MEHRHQQPQPSESSDSGESIQITDADSVQLIQISDADSVEPIRISDVDSVKRIEITAADSVERIQITDADSVDDQLPSLDELEKILGYKFNDKNLLEEAFTDSSFPHKSFSYERLEHLGDSVLNLLITKEHYIKYPDSPPGALTRLRAANVDTEKLARVAVKHGFHRFLRHNKPLLREQIREFSQAILDYPLHSNGLIDAPKVLADIVESTIGAVFFDSNSSTDIVWKVFEKFLEPIIDRETLKVHPVTELYEVCQKRNLRVKFVDLWRESMEFNVLIEDQLVGRGTYGLKKEIAHNRAAKDALDNLATILGDKMNCM
ncbi:ribonuclease 3-like protein 3 [Mercurialis annua]|uniref:ribonuclease 3-like protein 3 n=1 Tax=Mercurialis annua TaxID=3986 RepID=UPI00216045E2|nr:ribonuclease 3-like protein 3 [Mercurialis annua]